MPKEDIDWKINVSGIEFHIETEIIFCQCSCMQTMPNLIPCCLAQDSFITNKVLNTSAYIVLLIWSFV